MDILRVEEQLQRNRFLLVASLCAISWDILIHVDQDLQLILRHDLSISSLLYLISRLTTLGQALALVLSEVFNSGPCNVTLELQLWLFAASSCSTSSLFLFRARAVYMGMKRPTLCFFGLWLLVFGSCVYTPFTVRSHDYDQLGGACIINESIPYCVACAGASLVKDTAVFFAISWRLLSFMCEDMGTRSRINYFFWRESLPRVSGTLLRGGQQYYLFTIAANIVMMMLMHSHTLPQVYRDVKLGLLVDDVPTQWSSWSAGLRFTASLDTPGGTSA